MWGYTFFNLFIYNRFFHFYGWVISLIWFLEIVGKLYLRFIWFKRCLLNIIKKLFYVMIYVKSIIWILFWWISEILIFWMFRILFLKIFEIILWRMCKVLIFWILRILLFWIFKIIFNLMFLNFIFLFFNINSGCSSNKSSFCINLRFIRLLFFSLILLRKL